MYRKKKIAANKSESSSELLIPYEKKKIALGLLFILFSILFLLSIVSYSETDKAYFIDLRFTDILSIFDKNSDVAQNLSKINNWLGLFGALLGNFLIHGTIGYFSVVFPVLLFIWGIAFIKESEYRKVGFYSNIILGSGILLATLFGVLGNSIELFHQKTNLYGIVGWVLSDLTIKILGSAGSLIVISSLLVLTCFLIMDINFKKVIDLPVYIWGKIFSRKKNAVKTKTETGRPKFINQKVEEEKIKKITEPIIPPTKINRMIESLVEETIPESISINERGKFEEKQPKVISFKDKPKPEHLPDESDTQTKIIEQWEEEIEYIPPSLDLLDTPRQVGKIDDNELNSNAELLRAKLALFDIEIENITVTPGPVVTLYEIVPSPGVKISRIVSLQDDIALALAAKGIRIIAPIPGKSAIGVEIPNNNPETVFCRSIFTSIKFRELKATLPVGLGKTTIGEIFVDDLAKMPHLLIAGATGSGKSVGINMIIMSLLYKLHPSDVKFVIIDPKKIELSFYKDLKHHFLASCPDINEDIITTAENSVTVLKAVEMEMEKRYDMLTKCGVRNISDYNERIANGNFKENNELKFHKLPYIVVIIDELADLMITAAREIEEPIARIAQLARAVGIHLILATQRPSVDVITGVIKANFNVRIAYQVASKIDSRTILDINGAEQLLGSGDMLYLPGNSPKPIRIQSAFVSTQEVEAVVNHIKKQKGYSKAYSLPSLIAKKKGSSTGFLSNRDELFEEAARLVVRHQQGSVSLIQRRLKVGYSRAARIIDELEEAGIVGPFDGSKARLVLVENEEQLDRILETLD